MRSKISTRLLAALLWTLTATGFAAETVRVGGVGSVTPLIQQLAADFEQRHPQITIQISPVPLGSSGSLRALAANKLDLALTGRLPKSTEGAPVVLPWIRTPLAFASKDGVRRKGFSLKEIADVYAGKLTTWEQGKPISLVLRAANESETQVLKSMSPDISTAVEQAMTRPGMAMAENDLDALEYLSRNPGSFGTVALGLVRSNKATLNVMAIDGIAPSAKNVANKTYPWFRSYWLIKNTAPTAATEQFVAYLQSPPARTLLERLEFLPGH